MTSIFLTQSSIPIIGPVAQVLGLIMNAIYVLFDNLGIQNIGLCIIVFTILINVLMLPLTIRQQKFSKLSARMNPELQAIQKKFKGKRDQESMSLLNAETKAVYEKYGTSPTGSCLQLAIQMPILFALYRVVSNVPAYVSEIKQTYVTLAEQLSSDSNINNFISFVDGLSLRTTTIDSSASSSTIQNAIIDNLYKMTTSNWSDLVDKFPDLSQIITATGEAADKFNSFLGLNITNSPLSLLQTSFTDGNYLMVFVAVMIPVLSAATQILNVKLMPQPAVNSDDGNNVMANSMKSMTYTMPIMSAVFTFSFPLGLAIYWIANSVMRSIQQVLINRHLNHVAIDEMIAKNQEKMKKKKEKMGVAGSAISNSAKINTKKIEDNKSEGNKQNKTDGDSTSKPGSLASKANLVKKYNDSNK